MKYQVQGENKNRNIIMKYKHSLSFRIIIGFSTMGLILITIYGFLIYWLIKDFETNRGRNRMEHDMSYYLETYKKDKNARVLHTPNLTTYIGLSRLPDNMKELLSDLEEGVYKTGKKGIGGIEGYAVGVAMLPDKSDKIFLIHDNKNTNFVKRKIRNMAFVLSLVATAMIILGAGLAFLLSKRVIAPLAQLAQTVERAGPDNLPTDISSVYYNDEVGALARAFENAMDRIKEFVERERQFTRDSSHELRSPLTVIKGSLALLKMKISSDDEKSIEVIQRIDRAVASMKNTVDCFLWLSREESGIESSEEFSVVTVVEKELETCRFIMEKRDVQVEILKATEPKITAPVHLFSIAVSNLIRNAMKYTDRGHVKITIHENRVEVSDTGVGIESDKVSLMQEAHQKGEKSNGFGLGLSIVKRICDSFGWKLNIESEKGKGTKAELFFQDQ